MHHSLSVVLFFGLISLIGLISTPIAEAGEGFLIGLSSPPSGGAGEGLDPDLPSLLRQMPEQVCEQLLLSRTNLLDLIDTYEAHATTPIRNRLNELVALDTLTADSCQLKLAPSTTATFTLSPDGEHIEMTLTTLLDGRAIASTRRYTLGWERWESR